MPTPQGNPLTYQINDSCSIETDLATDAVANDSVKIKYTCNKQAWIGLGFGPTMTNTDMLTFTYNGN